MIAWHSWWGSGRVLSCPAHACLTTCDKTAIQYDSTGCPRGLAWPLPASPTFTSCLLPPYLLHLSYIGLFFVYRNSHLKALTDRGISLSGGPLPLPVHSHLAVSFLKSQLSCHLPKEIFLLIPDPTPRPFSSQSLPKFVIVFLCLVTSLFSISPTRI